MADSSRVEELRKRYHENPRRFFAPLANEYRKSGFLDRAILLCQKHLGEQPGNMNGLIVYGQTLFESGRHDDARGPFESALELDPENLIALRHLGDIARLGGDQATARKWYSRVLEYDRRNEEVRELLAQVDGADPAPAAQPAESAAPSTPALPAAKTLEVTPRRATTPAAGELASRPATSPRTLEITPRRVPTPAHAAKEAPAARAATPARGQRRASLLDIDFDFGELASAEPKSAPAPAAPLMGSEAAEYGFAASDLPLLDPVADAPVESLMSMAPASESLIELPPETESLGEIAHIDGLEMAEFEADVEALPDLESSEFSAGDVGIAPLPELETAEFQVPTADDALSTLPELEVTGIEEPEFEIETAFPHEEVAASAKPAIVTETMAELYLEQGHRAEAIEVYRKLIALDPSDGALRARLAALEAPEPAFEMADEDAAVAELEFIDTSTPMSVPAVATPVVPVAATPPAPPASAALVGLEMLDDLDVPDVATPRDIPRVSMEFDVPADAEQEVPERAPANSMLAEVSFADLELSTPEPASAAEPEPASGPTAREFFAAFAERTLAAPRVPVAAVAAASAPSSGGWAIPASISSLDDLFGGEVTDEDQRAANYLAGIGTTSAPSGTSSFDALFASSEPSHTPARNAVPRASEKLKFDQFFSASSSGATNAAPPPAPEPPSAPSAAPDDDDLDQFQGWLKGLTQ